jgi:hypothetical protein
LNTTNPGVIGPKKFTDCQGTEVEAVFLLSTYFADWCEQWALAFLVAKYCSRCIVPKVHLCLPAYHGDWPSRSYAHLMNCIKAGTEKIHGYHPLGPAPLASIGAPFLLPEGEHGFFARNKKLPPKCTDLFMSLLVDRLHMRELAESELGIVIQNSISIIQTHAHTRVVKIDMLMALDTLGRNMLHFPGLQTFPNGFGTAQKAASTVQGEGSRKIKYTWQWQGKI